MVRDEGGRWDVGRKNDVVYLERVDESNEQLFDDWEDDDEEDESSD